MNSRIKSDFLVATPSVANGAARLLDFYGQFDSYNRCASESEADSRAAYADWRATGEDISSAMSDYTHNPASK